MCGGARYQLARVDGSFRLLTKVRFLKRNCHRIGALKAYHEGLNSTE